ncbi:MAG: TlpA disulfide reductase family protein [Candidatus Planktophila sp.]|nr:TlpA disulfide reductase family protein [Candidatus Planktophila sp.]
MSFFYRYLSFIVVALILAGCSGGGGGASSAQESFVSGNGLVTLIKSQDRIEAPSLTGMTLSGTNYSHVSGRVTVVNVWASWCAPCRSEMPTLIALSKKYKETTFIGILTRDNLPTAEAFQRRFQIPYPTLIDDSILIGFKGSLPANAIPTTVVIDRDGKVAGRISGAITVASLSKLIETVSNE